MSTDANEVGDALSARLTRRHLRIGWWALALFVVLGTMLELLHAVKSPAYLDAGRETTRLLLRLAHAHGTGLALVNIAYALTVHAAPRVASVAVSACVAAAVVLLPAGFFLGGVWAHGGDPGLGVALVPAGALALAFAAAAVAWSVGRAGGETS